MLTSRRLISTWLPVLALLILSMAIGCGGDNGTGPSPRVVTTVEVSLESAIEVGQFVTATAVVLDQYGAPLDAGPVTWLSTFPEVAVVSPTTGQILAIASGRTQITATVAGKVGDRTVTVSSPAILINEVRPNGDLGGGFVELFNPTASAIDIGGWTLTNNDVFHSFTIPTGASILPGAYRVIDESFIPGGLGASDGVHLFSRFGVQSDAYAWAASPATSYGRCADGIGAFVTNVAITRGGTNACP